MCVVSGKDVMNIKRPYLSIGIRARSSILVRDLPHTFHEISILFFSFVNNKQRRLVLLSNKRDRSVPTYISRKYASDLFAPRDI